MATPSTAWTVAPNGALTITHPSTSDTYHIQPWIQGNCWVVSGRDILGALYWIGPDGTLQPQIDGLPVPTFPSRDGAVAALDTHWKLGALSGGSGGGIHEAFAAALAPVLRVALLLLGRHMVQRGCAPDQVNQTLAWLKSPTGQEEAWGLLRKRTAMAGAMGGGILAVPLVFGPGGTFTRAGFDRVITYLRTPDGEATARSVIQEICSGAAAFLGTGSVTVAPGVATGLAQQVEALGHGHRGHGKTCPAVWAARELRAFDADQIRRARTNISLGWGPSGSVVEALGASLGQGSLTVNARRMWQMATRDLYKTDDLVSLAVREALQNATDGVRRALRKGLLSPGEGMFAVSWQPLGNGTGVLEFVDNGVGMPEEILVGKFLELGSTGKSEEDSGEDAGGFGMAKAVILGASPTFHWEIHTQNRVVQSLPNSVKYEMFEADSYRQGVRLTLYDIPDQTLSGGMFPDYLGVAERVRRVLAWSHVPDIRLTLDGIEVPSEFPFRRGSRLSYPEVTWGDGVTVNIKGYKRLDTNGSILVRLKGLLQFVTYGVAGLSSDIVLDMETTLRPGKPGYPLPPSRDSLRGAADWGLYALRKVLQQENKSGDDEREYDDLLPDASTPQERAGAQAFADELASALDDPEIRALLAEMATETNRIQEEGKAVQVESTAPAGPGQEGEDPYAGWRSIAKAVPSAKDLETPEGRRALGQVLTKVTTLVSGSFSDGADARDTIKALLRGEGVTEGDVGVLLRVVGSPLENTSPGESGLLDAGAQATVIQAVSQLVQASSGVSSTVKAAVKKKASEINPFGSAALVKISRKNFDKAEAKAFLRKSRKYLSHLAAWEAITRTIHKETGIQVRYKPGFVLDNSVRALAFATGESGQGRQAYVLVNPITLDKVVQTSKDRPDAIAAWIYTVACHELAHLPHMGKRHGEDFVLERENLQLATGHLLPAFTRIVVRAFRLKDPETRQVKTLRTYGRKLREQVADLEAKLRRAEQAQAAARSEIVSTAGEEADRLLRISQDLGWDPAQVMIDLNALGRAEQLRAWLLSEEGARTLGTSHPAIIDLLAASPRPVVLAFQRILSRLRA